MRQLIGSLIYQPTRQTRGPVLKLIARQQLPFHLQCSCCSAYGIFKMIELRRFWNGSKSMLVSKGTHLKAWSMMSTTARERRMSRCATLSTASAWFRTSIGRPGLMVSVLLTRHCAKFLSMRKWIFRAGTCTVLRLRRWRADHPTEKLILFTRS